ncbi:MAG: response regulator [Candidatus Nitrosocosmicus sp.]
MVVNDNIDIANIIENALEKDIHNVRVLDNPLLALEYFKSNTKETAVIILDARIPGINGIELYQILRIQSLKSKQ